MGWHRLWTGLLALAIAIVLPSSAFAERRVALVIGNSAYQNVPELLNPRNDAADMAAKLQGLGFEVTAGNDLDLTAMRLKVRDFIKQLDGAQMAMLFYAGHGLQVNGVNYMVPVDAKLSSHDDLEFEALPMDLVLSAMERNAKVNLVFLDACRDNPLARNLARSMGTRSAAVGAGLARIGSGVGSLIAFSTQPGNVALDGAGRNSPFTAALLKHLGTPGQDITRDLVFVRRDVLEATGGKQVPWDSSSLTGEVILLPGGEPGAGANDTAAPSSSAEVTFWDSVKDASDKSYFNNYLEKYPNGLFANLAKLRIGEIETYEAAQAERERQDKEEAQKKIEQAKLEAERTAKLHATELPGLPGSAVVRSSSSDAQTAKKLTVASLGPDADPRLIGALPVLGQYEIRHGIFRKNLYIAVLTWGTEWLDAHRIATRAGGHLVTITDKDENDFVYKLFASDDRFIDIGDGGKDIHGPWIGLYQPTGSKEPNGGWRWVTEEPFKYKNWLRSQPNNYQGDSNVGIFYSYGARDPGEEQRPIMWDDTQGYHPKRGFIVEFEAVEKG